MNVRSLAQHKAQGQIQPGAQGEPLGGGVPEAGGLLDSHNLRPAPDDAKHGGRVGRHDHTPRAVIMPTTRPRIVNELNSVCSA